VEADAGAVRANARELAGEIDPRGLPALSRVPGIADENADPGGGRFRNARILQGLQQHGVDDAHAAEAVAVGVEQHGTRHGFTRWL
jgi:hypothetical protein